MHPNNGKFQPPQPLEKLAKNHTTHDPEHDRLGQALEMEEEVYGLLFHLGYCGHFIDVRPMSSN